jgi:FlaA1/EpsC-like NDP-sugar epimerase
MPFFLNKKSTGVLPITNKNMTRFNISLEDGCQMVFDAIENAWGGELFVPKIPSYRILDVAKAIAPECNYEEVGIRPGEKLHEEMITVSDAINTYDIGKYYTILPQKTVFDRNKFINYFNAKLVDSNFSYSSGENTDWETVDSLRKLVKKHVDRNFVA